jgi:hypothetical protein
MYRDARHTHTTFGRASALAIALFGAFCAAGCASDVAPDVGETSSALAMNSTDDFEAAVPAPASPCGANWDPNNNVNWTLTGENGNSFCNRNAASTSWSDGVLTPAINNDTVVVSAMVRINAWNDTVQNRVHLFARGNNTNSTDTMTAYHVAIVPDSSIRIERRAANKTMTLLMSVQWMQVVESWNPGMWNRVQIQVGADPTLSGHTLIAMYVNGLFAGSYSETTPSGYGSGNVGYGSVGANADFDDVMVGDGTQFDAPEGDINPACHIPGSSTACNSSNACQCDAAVAPAP